MALSKWHFSLYQFLEDPATNHPCSKTVIILLVFGYFKVRLTLISMLQQQPATRKKNKKCLQKYDNHST